jgi:hypothetical protein
MANLIITIDLDKHVRPSPVELHEAGFPGDESGWWREYAFRDPTAVLCHATWEIVDSAENPADQRVVDEWSRPLEAYYD